MQEVFNWFYTMIANVVNWLFAIEIVPNISVGMFMILAIISGIAAANLIPAVSSGKDYFK